MDTQKGASLLSDLNKRIRSLSVDKEILRSMLEVLQERSYSAGDIELTHFKQLDQSDEQYEQNKKTLKDGFKLYVTVAGKDGRKLNGSIEDVFESPNFPDDILSVYLDSSLPLRAVHNWSVRNSIVLFLDFNKPEVFNFSLQPSQETPNASNITVKGNDITWVNGVFNEFNKIIESHPSSLAWLHRHTIYDIIVWLLGLPFGFWMCYKASSLIQKTFGQLSTFLQNATYVYLFFISLVGLRVLFHYARWIWPLVEYKGKFNKSLKHRVIWSGIIVGLASSIIHDLIKLIS